MAAATILYDFSLQGAEGPPSGALELDVVTTQAHELPADVTEFPIEKGASPSDHYQPKPETFSIEAVIAEFRLGQSVQEEGRIKTAMAILTQIRDTGTLVSYRSLHRNGDNLALLGLKFSFGPKGGNVLRFSCTLKQVVIVETKTVAIVKKRVGTPGAKPNVNEGNKATDRVPDSILFSMLGNENDTVSTSEGRAGPLTKFPGRFGAGP